MIIRRLYDRWQTHLRLLRELETGKIEYDSRSDDVCLAPGIPLTDAHIEIVLQRPYLANSWPRHLRVQIGLPPYPPSYDDDFINRFW